MKKAKPFYNSFSLSRLFYLKDLKVAIGTDNGRLSIKFSKEVRSFSLGQYEAEDFIKSILENAKKISSYLDLAEAALYLGVKEPTIYSYVRRGQLERKEGKLIFSEIDLALLKLKIESQNYVK